VSKEELDEIRFSGIGEMFNLANRIGGDLIRFETGDVDFATPAHIVESATEQLHNGLTHYAPYKGYDTLRQAIVNKLALKNRITKSLEDILVTSGGSGALYLAFQALLSEGDEVIISNPSWPHFAEMIRLAGGVPVEAPFISRDGREFDSAILENAITSKTRIILVNSPHNPSGAVLNKKDLREIAAIAEKCGATVLSDEVYESFVFDSNEHESIATISDNVVSVYSFSKTYAMCGWRLGYISANPILVERMTKLNLYSVTCIPPFIQLAGLAALEGDQTCVYEMVHAYQKRRDQLVTGLNAIPGVKCPSPRGSVYVWPDISYYGDSRNVAKQLVEKAKCVTVPGCVFGSNGEGRLRLSLSLDEAKIAKGIARLGEGLQSIAV